MKHKRSLFRLLITTLAFVVLGKSIEIDPTARVLIFSKLDESVYHLYLRIRNDNPYPQELDSSQFLDVTRKKQICDDISNDCGYDRVKIEEKKKNADQNSSLVEFTVYTTLDAYLRKTFMERGFICTMSTNSGEYTLTLFISIEYNINTSSNLPADYIAGRFLYTIEKNKKIKNPILFGLAEVPAKGISSPNIDVESNYLEKKNMYTAIPSEPEKDPLCSLNHEDKLRICFAVFNSTYFSGDMEYNRSEVNSIDENCVRKTITLRTPDEGEKIHPENKFDEWLLSCARRKRSVNTFDPPFNYYISHAYEPNAIFVYFIDKERDRLIFLENLSINVRINVDVSKFPKVSQIRNDLKIDVDKPFHISDVDNNKLPQVVEAKT